jgi:hypothetical protein
LALLVASPVLAWRPRSHRGLSGLTSGLMVVDTRTAHAETEQPRNAIRTEV